MRIVVLTMLFIPLASSGQVNVIYGDSSYISKMIEVSMTGWHEIDSSTIDTTLIGYDLKDSLPTGNYIVYYNNDTTGLATVAYYSKGRRAHEWTYFDTKIMAIKKALQMRLV